MNRLTVFFVIVVTIFSVYLISSYTKQNSSPASKYKLYCSSCHLLPDLQNIPKSIWQESVLPEMAARMGYRYNNFDPHDLPMEEDYYVRLSNVYPENSIIDSTDWQEIHDYILSQAPDEVLNTPTRKGRSSPLTQFRATPHTLGQNASPSGVTSIKFDSLNSRLFVGNHFGQLYEWGDTLPFNKRFTSPITSCLVEDSTFYLTEIGIMNPSEIPRGSISRVHSGTVDLLYENLHRPVYTEVNDLNEDGVEEIIVCEFGYYTGELSLLVKKGSTYVKRTLVSLPGSIKVEVRDMNFDGKKDIVALFSQGREGIYILYQKDDLSFRVDNVIKMQAEYGSSWFELIDYNKDGYLDIALVNGDNADLSNFLKPYHGIRLFINDGKNNFGEKWFYPINGATRLVAEDFDLDGDLDFAVLSFFPDFANNPEEGFVYLENKDPANFQFESYATENAKNGNWLVMEKGDIDKDGDVDILLGNYPVLQAKNSTGGDEFDILYLENSIISQ